LLSDQAITCLVAVGLVIPIAAGVIDLAIGTEVGLGTILVARLLVGSLPIPLAIVLSLMSGGAVGVFSWLMITRARIPSFIATLAVSSLLTAGSRGFPRVSRSSICRRVSVRWVPASSLV